ncbi:unnamed protein product [Miscanthus lutarioriparius]|uniref:Disease resistance N-terminal domain-containing protein n=1 Tax=Miscanthus lutarioriparius TaxID=422564 RepID=A0A811MA70_9POAL|nr:unnamed protein product [Miscanthus lutarioriparius]
MEVGIEAARWVVGKALGPAAGEVLEAWAASSELGTNIRALRMELLYAQGMLNNACGREDIQNPALVELLQELRDLVYSADDALDEVDYFRIQDEPGPTFSAASPLLCALLLLTCQAPASSKLAAMARLGLSTG